MSDYLTHLASRTMGRAAVVRPLTPSRLSRGPSVVPAASSESPADTVTAVSGVAGRPVSGNRVSTGQRVRRMDQIQRAQVPDAITGHIPSSESVSSGSLGDRRKGRETDARGDAVPRPRNALSSGLPVWAVRPDGLAEPAGLRPAPASRRLRTSGRNRDAETVGEGIAGSNISERKATHRESGLVEPAAVDQVASSERVSVRHSGRRSSKPDSRSRGGAEAESLPGRNVETGAAERLSSSSNTPAGEEPQIVRYETAASPLEIPRAEAGPSRRAASRRLLVPALEPPHDRTAVRPIAARQVSQTSERPVVKVTIGRIEVRAVAPPAPVQSVPVSSRPKPALALSEYLRQRTRGER